MTQAIDIVNKGRRLGNGYHHAAGQRKRRENGSLRGPSSTSSPRCWQHTEHNYRNDVISVLQYIRHRSERLRVHKNHATITRLRLDSFLALMNLYNTTSNQFFDSKFGMLWVTYVLIEEFVDRNPARCRATLHTTNTNIANTNTNVSSN